MQSYLPRLPIGIARDCQSLSRPLFGVRGRLLGCLLVVLLSYSLLSPKLLLANGPLVTQEIRYHMLEAGEVFLAWGINGWQLVPEEMRPAGTVVKNYLMLTPMMQADGIFSVKLQLPAGSTLDYGFLITKTSEGAEVDVWEGVPNPLTVSDSGLVEIQTKKMLPRGQVAALIFDVKMRWPALLLLIAGLGLTVGMIAVSHKRPAFPIFRYLNYANSNLVKLVLFAIAIKLLVLFIGYLAYASYTQPNEELVDFKLAYLKQIISSFNRGDVGAYMHIAQHGYERRPFTSDQQANWAFYPLWPVALKLGSLLSSKMLLWGILLCNTLFLLAMIFLYKLISLDFDEPIAMLTSVLLIIYPGSYFFSRPGPEALFMLLVVTSFYAAKKNHWLLAGLLASLAVLSRLQGLLLFFCLLYIYYKQYKLTKTHNPKVLSVLLIPIALLLFMAHLYRLTGNMFASFDIQEAWSQRLSYPFAAMVQFLSQPRIIDYGSWNLTPVSFILVFFAVVLTIMMIKQPEIPREYLLYTILNLYLVIARNTLQASLRFMLPVFPLFLILALVISKRQLLYNLVFFAFVALHLFYFVSFIQQYNWAGT